MQYPARRLNDSTAHGQQELNKKFPDLGGAGFGGDEIRAVLAFGPAPLCFL
jgi:hypothetical protein